MFSRVIYENFQLLFPIIGFFLFAGIFLGVVIKVFLTKRKKIEELSNLPLKDDEKPKAEKAPASSKNRDHVQR